MTEGGLQITVGRIVARRVKSVEMQNTSLKSCSNNYEAQREAGQKKKVSVDFARRAIHSILLGRTAPIFFYRAFS